jgi:hypothetical protein
LNGRLAGQEWLAAADATDAPLSLGGVLSGGKPVHLKTLTNTKFHESFPN